MVFKITGLITSIAVGQHFLWLLETLHGTLVLYRAQLNTNPTLLNVAILAHEYAP